jgi:hypothetical protein
MPEINCLGEVWMINNLKNELKSAIRQHYKELAARYPGEKFYGYSLYTSDDVEHLCPVVNSISSLGKDKNLETKYFPDEWNYWDNFGIFDTVQEIIESCHAAVDEEDEDSGYDYEVMDFELSENAIKLRKSILQIAVESLYELKVEGVFGEETDKTYLVVWISDSDDEVMDYSVKKLNSDKMYQEFKKVFC